MTTQIDSKGHNETSDWVSSPNHHWTAFTAAESYQTSTSLAGTPVLTAHQGSTLPKLHRHQQQLPVQTNALCKGCSKKALWLPGSAMDITQTNKHTRGEQQWNLLLWQLASIPSNQYLRNKRQRQSLPGPTAVPSPQAAAVLLTAAARAIPWPFSNITQEKGTAPVEHVSPTQLTGTSVWQLKSTVGVTQQIPPKAPRLSSSCAALVIALTEGIANTAGTNRQHSLSCLLRPDYPTTLPSQNLTSK